MPKQINFVEHGHFHYVGSIDPESSSIGVLPKESLTVGGITLEPPDRLRRHFFPLQDTAVALRNRRALLRHDYVAAHLAGYGIPHSSEASEDELVNLMRSSLDLGQVCMTNAIGASGGKPVRSLQLIFLLLPP